MTEFTLPIHDEDGLIDGVINEIDRTTVNLENDQIQSLIDATVQSVESGDPTIVEDMAKKLGFVSEEVNRGAVQHVIDCSTHNSSNVPVRSSRYLVEFVMNEDNPDDDEQARISDFSDEIQRFLDDHDGFQHLRYNVIVYRVIHRKVMHVAPAVYPEPKTYTQDDIEALMQIAHEAKKHFSHRKDDGKWYWCDKDQIDVAEDYHGPFNTFFECLKDACEPYIEKQDTQE